MKETRRSRSELSMTTILDKDIAAAAAIGCTMPTAAKGIIRAL